MHELSIAQALLGEIKAACEREGIPRALAVKLRIGSLSGVERHALEMAFPIAVESAGLEPIELEIEIVPASVECRECGHSFSPDQPLFLCERCESVDVEIVAGRELEISSIRFERPHQ